MSRLIANARRIGVEPADYAKRLIEDALAFEREAEESSFARIMKPVRDAAGDLDEVEIIRLVETARVEHHAKTSRRRKKG
jgi:hypothetical protein